MARERMSEPYARACVYCWAVTAVKQDKPVTETGPFAPWRNGRAVDVIGSMQKDSPNLDLLRSLAVLFVVISHLLYFAPAAMGVPRVSWYDPVALGHLGVAMFFVHTTLVLMLSLERHGADFGAFLVRRVFRIYPLSMAVVVMVGAIAWASGTPVGFNEFVSNLMLVQNLTDARSNPPSLWTLPLELQMYLFLPALFVLAASNLLRISALLVAAVGVSIATGTWRGMTFISVIPCFLPGALAYALPKRDRSPLILFSLIAIAALVVPFAVASGVPSTPVLWLVCLSLGFVIPACRDISGPALRRLGNTVARYSYGVYILHPLAIGMAFSGGTASSAEWLTFAVMLAGYSYIAYHTVEKRGIAMGSRLADRMVRSRGSRPGQPFPVPAGPQP